MREKSKLLKHSPRLPRWPYAPVCLEGARVFSSRVSGTVAQSAARLWEALPASVSVWVSRMQWAAAAIMRSMRNASAPLGSQRWVVRRSARCLVIISATQ